MTLARSEGGTGESRFAVSSGRIALAIAVAGSLSALGGCASPRYGRMPAPEGGAALGLPFGQDRAAVERVLRGAGLASRAAPDDADALVAERCPSAPVAAPCRLLFGPQGLYAAEIEVPAGEAGALASAVEKGLGPPERAGEAAPAAEGMPALVASWQRQGFTVTVARAPPQAALRVESEAAAPPVVAGVLLGRLREDVERALASQGATLVQRDGGATTYLACPQGSGEALSCVVLYRAGRAAAVTEVHPAAGDDRSALAAWQSLARRFEQDIGRPPHTTCPDYGPDRVGGDCTATWASDRLVVVVGAHRNAGSSHRGAISVYTAFTYPPLAGKGDEEVLEAQ